jgi:hypothetical protein
VSPTQKKRPARPRSRARRATSRSVAKPSRPAPATATAAVSEVESPLEIAVAAPERDFATRMPTPAPERPWPSSRRAIFFDVENTSQVNHIARVIDHLRIDRAGQRTEFIAVGNWRVIGHDTARLLARHGAQLVHSAPSVGVRDWSDLRIAVGAGAWLAAARPGDVIEIISDDRAFDAVGDVAASLGITYQRLSYRSLTGATTAAPPEAVAHLEPRAERGRHGRRHGRGRHRGEAPAQEPPRRGGGHRPAVHPPAQATPAAAHAAPSESGSPLPHTAPHDELLAVVRDLDEGTPGNVTLDALANALKQRGFSRPPGSPRLITRLRRIRELEVSRSGVITLVDAAAGGGVHGPRAEAPRAASAGDRREPVDAEVPVHAVIAEAAGRRAVAQDRREEMQPDDVDGNVAPPEHGGDEGSSPERAAGARRRRSRRGGRRHRRRAPATQAG